MTFADIVFILWLVGMVVLILYGAVSLYQSHKDIKEIERKRLKEIYHTDKSGLGD